MSQISRSAITKSQWAAIGLSVLFVTGCSYPKFTEVTEPAKRQAWVERAATLTSDQTGSIETTEIVFTDEATKVIGPEERVIWVSGVDVLNSRLQRSHQRIDGQSALLTNAINKSALIKAYSFGIHGDELSVEGKLALKSFKATPMDRFYVEFLNSGPMSDSKVTETMDAWKKVLPQLRQKGLDGSNVILGGAKYEQAINAIVLVKVGK